MEEEKRGDGGRRGRFGREERNEEGDREREKEGGELKVF